MEPTRLFLARHGSTPLVEENRFSGALGVELSEVGRSQAAALGERLRGEGITAVYSSPMSRALETARFSARALGLEPMIRDGLREISHGHWEGMKRSEVEERFADEYAAWEADPFRFAPEGGESGVEVLARALPVIRTIVGAHPGEHVLVVSHKATIRLILCRLLGIDARGYRDRLDQSPACLNTLDFRDAVHARLVSFNDVSHYTPCPLPVGPRLSPVWDRPQ